MDFYSASIESKIPKDFFQNFQKFMNLHMCIVTTMCGSNPILELSYGVLHTHRTILKLTNDVPQTFL